MKIILIPFFLLLVNIVKSQDRCPMQNLFKTNYIGDGKDMPGLQLPLNFIVKPDSLIISVDTIGKKPFIRHYIK